MPETQPSFFVSGPLPTPEDIAALRLCGSVAQACWWEKIFWRLKDVLLQTYGGQVDYALQSWEDDCSRTDDSLDDDCCPCGYQCPFAAHFHILARWELVGEIFHRPTDEFHYLQYCDQIWNHSKKSERFDEMKKQTVEQFVGKKKIQYQNKAPAWRALLGLIRKFRDLL